MSELNTQSNFSNSSLLSHQSGHGILGATPSVGKRLSASESGSLLSSAVNASGLAKLSQDESAWHKKMGVAYSYGAPGSDPGSFSRSASESFRRMLMNALQTGNWAQLGIPISAVPSEQMEGRPAAFLGGDTATSADDRIVVNQDLLRKSTHNDIAKSQLNEAITEEILHAAERRIHKGKSGDMQLNKAGDIEFMQAGQGGSFDEGKFARELLKQPGFHSFADIKLQSMNEDHGNVYMDGEVSRAEYNNLYNPNTHPIDSVANENKDHSVRWRINEQKWSNNKIDHVFDGPEAFAKIWGHSEHDKDLVGWLNDKNLHGTRNKTRGVTEYVGWVLDQADPENAPKAQAQKEKLLGKGGLLSDNDNWINHIKNEEIDGINAKGETLSTEVDPGLLKHLSVEQLVTMKGSRSGTNNVQEALGLKFAEDPSQLEKLKNYFAQSNNGTDFLNKLSDGQISGLNADVLKAIPPEQIQAAKGGRSNAAQSALVKLDRTDTTPSNNNASQVAPSEIVSALKNRLADKKPEELTTQFFDDYFRGALGAEPSGDKANTPREIEIFEAMAAENSYTGWEKRIAAEGGEAAAKSFRASTLGQDFARWSLRSNENDNGADATTNQAMGNELSRKLLGEGGNNLGNMSNADQQWYLDNWIKPNVGLEEYLYNSLSIPAQAVAEAKAANGGKLPEGPLVEYLDGINTISADVEKEIGAANPGRDLLGSMGEKQLRGPFISAARNRFSSITVNSAAGATQRVVSGATGAAEAAGATGAVATFEALALGATGSAAIFAGATATMNAADQKLRESQGPEGGGGKHFNPNTSEETEPIRPRGGAGARENENSGYVADESHIGEESMVVGATQNATGKYAPIGAVIANSVNNQFSDLPNGIYSYDAYGNIYDPNNGDMRVRGFVYAGQKIRKVNGTRIENRDGVVYKSFEYREGHGVKKRNSDGKLEKVRINKPQQQSDNIGPGGATNFTQNATGNYAIIGSVNHVASEPDSLTNRLEGLHDGNYGYDQYGNLYDPANGDALVRDFVLVNGKIWKVNGQRLENENGLANIEFEYVKGHGVSEINKANQPLMMPVNEPKNTQNAMGAYDPVDYVALYNSNNPFSGLPNGNYDYDRFGNLYDTSRNNEHVNGFVLAGGNVYEVKGNSIVAPNGLVNQNYYYQPDHGLIALDEEGNLDPKIPINNERENPYAPLGSVTIGADNNPFADDLPNGNYNYDKFGNLYDPNENNELVEGFVFVKDNVYKVDGENIVTPNGLANQNYKYIPEHGVVALDEDGYVNLDIPINEPQTF